MDFSKKDKSDEKQAVGNCIKVFLVEDDNFLMSICSQKLLKQGFTVYEASDGQTAVNEVEKVKPDIVLLDILLPALNGFEVLSKIRGSSVPEIANVPVIVLSNLGEEENIKRAMELGANDYLVKAHFTTDAVVDKIKGILNK